MSEAALEIDDELAIPLAELSWQFSSSGGPGGQNVNKTSTRVELLFDLEASPSVSSIQKKRIRHRLSRLVDGNGVLHIVSQESSSQWQNRQQALQRFQMLLASALVPVRPRVPTRPSAAQRARRRYAKGQRSQSIRRRRVPRPDDW